MSVIVETRATQSTTPPGPPPSPMRGEMHESLSAYVMALGDRVYKMKKPVRTPFLDLSTRSARWAACTREVTLNTRFAPDVYEGVAELSDLDGGMGEPLVAMRRMPSHTRLSTLAESGADLHHHIDRIAELMAAVHADGPFGDTIDSAGTRDALARRWRDRLRSIASAAGNVLSEDDLLFIDARVRTYLAGRGALFDHRLSNDRIVDGHGDLIADDIFCLPDGPRILDCLDADDSLRHLDGIDDIACLAMDLRFHDRPDLAAHLVSAYRSAAQDDAPESLVHHYIAYRSLTRAAAACTAAGRGAQDAVADVRAHTALALDHLRRGAVGLALVSGVPGTGKSTVARGLAARIGGVVISSDIVRREIAGTDPTVSMTAGLYTGLHTPSCTGHTYAEMLRRARRLLAHGVSVVLDATFTDPVHLSRASMIAECTHSRLLHLECRAPDSVALARIEQRRGGPSDATTEMYAAVAAERARSRVSVDPTAPPLPGASVLDTTGRVPDVLDRAAALWDGAIAAP
ncbi:bifunctional aminoglycoside phosphotransferase/ATP-binding protein [Rhodococcoides corynebacterioides]|uniref:bifunctional aminoglycoside phosphotransferase/ATP-binding protein n=1 Tax=Rhodococcoides corynebacterioides TaxID=53972 RepID=UPI0009ED607C|nr:AAA family ATPase [Rhodococcus corynebacterioides]